MPKKRRQTQKIKRQNELNFDNNQKINGCKKGALTRRKERCEKGPKRHQQ